MSSMAESIFQGIEVSQNEPGQVNPAVLLEALLAAATNLVKETKAVTSEPQVPPPQVLVRWNSHKIAFSRFALQRSSMLVMYNAFSDAFDIVNKAVDVKVLKQWDKSIRDTVSYVPMKFYITFLWASGAETKTEHEASDWEDSWRGILTNIDEIHIYTLPEYHARRKREEEVFKEAQNKRDGDSTGENNVVA